MAATLAPAIRAWEGSVMRPTSEAFVDCALMDLTPKAHPSAKTDILCTGKSPGICVQQLGYHRAYAGWRLQLRDNRPYGKTGQHGGRRASGVVRHRFSSESVSRNQSVRP